MVLPHTRRQHLLLVTFGLLFALLLGSLIAQGGLPQFNPLPELFHFGSTRSDTPPPPATIPPWPLQIAIIAIFVGGFASLLYALVTRQKWLRQDLVSTFLAFLLIMAILWLLTGVAGQALRTEEGGEPPGDGVPPSPPLGGAPRPSGTFLALLAWLVIFGVLVYILFAKRLASLRTAAPPSSVATEARAEAQTAIERTLAELAEATDPRAAIFRCYLELREILGRYGLREGRSATPREFQSAAEALLVLPSGELTGLVGLFEEARYSPHPMGPGAAMRAQSHLEAVREALTRAPPDVERVAREAQRRAEVRRWLASR